MTLNIFSLKNIWSRTKQPYGRITEIESIDSNNDALLSTNPFSVRTNDLYIGTIDGFVHKFRLREKPSDKANTSETKTYECLCIGNQNLGTHKPIMKLKVATITLHRVFLLSDNSLHILDSDNLQPIPNIKLKNLVTFAIVITSDQTQGGYVDICLSTKRNKVQIYRLDKINLNLIHEVSTPDSFISLAIEERGILACSETEYFGHELSMSNDRRSIRSFNSIFKLDDPNIVTCFTNISPGQYLLNGPNVGVTTSLQGMSQRAPMMFIQSPLDFIYSHPYLIVLLRDSLHIYSYLDDQLKQEIPLKHARTLTHMLQENLKSIIITDKDNIYLLEPLSVEEQIEQLLNSYRLQEALTLAESHCPSVRQRTNHSLVLSTKKRIALIEFGAMNVVRALKLFEEIRMDFHEIINQIPSFLPLNSPWPTIDESMKNQYQQWLNAFCDYMIKRATDFSRQSDYYPALLKAYLLIKSPEFIIEFLQNYSSHIPLDYSILLLDAHLYHAAANLYASHNQHEQAIDIWKKLVLEEFSSDETFPGIWILAKYILERNLNRTLEFSVAEWLLAQNEEELALKIFTGKYQNESKTDPFSSDQVIQSLKNHSSALITYLEHIVFQLKLENDQIHTTLVNIYLDLILSQSTDYPLEQIRSKLQAFLITSNSYRVQSIFNRINPISYLRREVALLYGKMNQFEQAFRILVDELEDISYAEDYCVALSQGKSIGDRQIVAHILFKILLNSLDKHPNEITEGILSLLSNREIEYNSLEILQRLPSTWSLASLAPFLLRACRTTAYTQRSTKIESSLVRLQNQRLHIRFSQLKTHKTTVREQCVCQYCFEQFYEPSCAVYPDGSQVHVHCAKKYQAR